MKTRTRATVIACTVSVCAGLAGTRIASAELVDISATIDATAVQYLDGVATLVDRETVEAAAGETGTAIASVEDFGQLGDEPRGATTSAMFFTDPFDPGPPGEFLGEFGGELLAVTLHEGISQQVTGDVFESRTILITPAEAGVGLGSAAAVSGEMYLHGAALIWWDRDEPFADTIEDLEALIGFEIELLKTGLEPQFVASGVIEIMGTETNELSVSTEEAISPDDVLLLDLSAEFPELGEVWLIQFPRVLMPYAYEAAVGEEYTLIGRLRLKGTTVPFHTGLAITTGGPFQNIADTLDEFYGSDVGTRLQARVDTELGNFPLPDVPVLNFEELSQACGATGVEAAGLVGLMGLMSLTGWRGRMRRRGR